MSHIKIVSLSLVALGVQSSRESRRRRPSRNYRDLPQDPKIPTIPERPLQPIWRQFSRDKLRACYESKKWLIRKNASGKDPVQEIGILETPLLTETENDCLISFTNKEKSQFGAPPIEDMMYFDTGETDAEISEAAEAWTKRIQHLKNMEKQLLVECDAFLEEEQRVMRAAAHEREIAARKKKASKDERLALVKAFRKFISNCDLDELSLNVYKTDYKGDARDSRTWKITSRHSCGLEDPMFVIQPIGCNKRKSCVNAFIHQLEPVNWKPEGQQPKTDSTPAGPVPGHE